MSIRLQVVMSEEELEEIRVVADRHRMTVSHWVRLVLREARKGDPGGRPASLREVPPRYGAAASGPTPRVRIEMDVKEELLDTVRERYHLPNRRAAVEYALRRAAVRPMSKEEALAMQGAGWDGDLDQLRAGDSGALW